MRGAMKSLVASAFATMGIAALAATPVAAGRAHTSKHRQFDQEGNWIPGAVKIAANSGLRKLMRAARRGLVPGERIFLIKTAQETSGFEMRHKWQRDASFAAVQS